MSLPRYPEYKDSGVEWLGEMPGHWEAGRFSRIINAIKDGTHGSFERVPVGRPLLSAKNVQQGYVLVSDDESCVSEADHLSIVGNGFPKAGDLLLTIVGTIGRSCIYEFDEPMAFQRSVCFIRLLPKNDSRFFFHFSQSKFFQEQLSSRSKSAAQGGVYMGDVVATSVVYPPLPEQTQIAAFLDRETAKIDELVAEQRLLMALLKEKRQAVISHAVTRGLNPDAPMKPSGIEWLGDVPEHWEVCSIRRVVSAIEQGWSPECHSRPADDDEWGVLKAGCVNRGIYDQQDNKALPTELAAAPEYEVRAGDVLMSRASGSTDLVGSTALVTSTRPKLMLSDKIFRLHFEPVIEPGFFVAALNSRPLRSQIEQALSGGNGLANNLPQSALLSFFLCVPSVVEQRAICVFLEMETAKLDTLTTEAQRAIDLLQERRTALISAAVTGQIDVRGAVAA